MDQSSPELQSTEGTVSANTVPGRPDNSLVGSSVPLGRGVPPLSRPAIAISILLVSSAIAVLTYSAFSGVTVPELWQQLAVREDETTAPDAPGNWALPQHPYGYEPESLALPNPDGDGEVKTFPGYTLRNDRVDYRNLYSALAAEPGVSWFDNPVPRGDLRLIEPAPESWLREYVFDYFEIGTYQGEPIIFMALPMEMGGGGFDAYFVFIGYPESGVRLVEQVTSYAFDGENYAQLSLAPQVTRDAQVFLRALSVPEYTYRNVRLINQHFSEWNPLGLGGFFANSPYAKVDGDTFAYQTEFVESTPYGPLFRGLREFPDSNTAYVNYALRLPGGFVANLRSPLPFIGDDRVPRITWNDGTENQTMYRTDGLGSCGGGGPEIYLGTFDEGELAPAGTVAGGGTVYNLVNPKHPLIERVFAVTEGRVFTYDALTGENEVRVISPEQFIAGHGVLVYFDALGQANVMTHGDYGPQAECAKPVVYLYPLATTTISVSVDALVTKSEPRYEGGWVATASPEGHLVVNGQSYTSLFWDGYGNGEYPEVTEGFVVPTTEALATMAEHLAYMGFTDREINDFVAFWSDHLPDEPYTTFHWLQTAEMEAMAKLHIDPRPTTLLRAFVDYQGVPAYFERAPQVLQRVERRGYVATEWGGLLKK